MKNFLTNLLSSEPLVFLKGAIIFLIGPLDLQLAYLLLAVGIDLVFGIQVAILEKKFKWSILFTKVKRKLIIYGLWITMFHAFDVIAGLPNTARWSVVVMLAGMELLSAIRNTAALGHSKLAEALERVYLALAKSLPGAEEETEKRDEKQDEGGVTNEKAQEK